MISPLLVAGLQRRHKRDSNCCVWSDSRRRRHRASPGSPRSWTSRTMIHCCPAIPVVGQFPGAGGRIISRDQGEFGQSGGKERGARETHKRLLYCVSVNCTSLDHLLLGKNADDDKNVAWSEYSAGSKRYQRKSFQVLPNRIAGEVPYRDRNCSLRPFLVQSDEHQSSPRAQGCEAGGVVGELCGAARACWSSSRSRRARSANGPSGASWR